MSTTADHNAWEHCKENAAPLQRGRRVATLNQQAATGGGLLQPSASREEKERQIQQFESLVRPSEAPHFTQVSGDEDPLHHWLSYIKFFQEQFPSDTQQQFLLMERCTRALVKIEHYADDDRFIGVCAKYADKTKDPNQVFKYLHQQKVGSNTALFWITWAYVAEKNGDFPFAEQIFKKGLRKNAQPLQMLKVRHSQFQRRMSRHWLNSSEQRQELDDEDEDDDGPGGRSRSALGGLSRGQVRQNDRGAPATARPARSLFRIPTDQNRSNRPVAATNNGLPGDGSFQIFVEQDGENLSENYLDRPIVEHKRVIEKDSDRRKENTLDAERWNERGALHATSSRSSSRSHSHSRSRAPGRVAPAFAVFVDEECAAQHQQEKAEKTALEERHRRVRDERTFRERGEDGMVDRLAKDPLRYLRDPSQLDSDLAAKEAVREVEAASAATLRAEKARSKTGFSKRLLKSSSGKEQSFEEARAKAKCFKIAPASENFNMLHNEKVHESSQMDLDEGASVDDVSMAESAQSVRRTTASKQPQKQQCLQAKPEGRVLFQNDQFLDQSLNQTTISSASSTFHGTDAVGIPTRKDEETINTKLAMKELSMMFSSPAFGVDGARQRVQQDVVDEDENEANISRILGTSTAILDNSILNPDTGDENKGPKNPFARSTSSPDFDKQALRDLKADQGSNESLRCRSAPVHQATIAQENPLRGPETFLSEDAGFQIHEDPDDEVERNQAPMAIGGFSIYQDDGDEDPQGTQMSEGSNSANKPNAKGGSSGFSIFQDDESEGEARPSNFASSMQRKPPAKIREGGSRTGNEPAKPAPFFDNGFEIHADLDDSDSSLEVAEHGDTASISLFGDAVSMLDGGTGDDQIRAKGQSQSHKNNGDGETATISLFNEIFEEVSEGKDQPLNKSSPPEKPKGGFEIFVENDEERTPRNKRCDALPPSSRKRRRQLQLTEREAIDYHATHDRDTARALRYLQNTASVAANSRTPLFSLLSSRGSTFHLPHVLLPREFRRKFVPTNTKFNIGKHCGVVVKELGRGAFGVVVLMANERDDEDLIALKAQFPTQCLAWEYEILKKLEIRVASKYPGDYSFPQALSFVSLADGSLLSMSAASESGLNLVDLSNFYRISLGEQVPELVALHYTSRMLRHIELLHWHGNILHCDVKPDNFVLSNLQCNDNPCRHIDFADVLLVDFGRAVDLNQLSEDHKEVRSVMMRGNACPQDMRCVAMRNEKPWSYDADTFGILCAVHVLLYGNHMQIRRGGKNDWKPATTLKRYWQRSLWEEIFSTLINHDDESGIGSRARSLRDLRKKVDDYLTAEAKGLHDQLKRQASLLPSSREKLN